MTTHILVNTRTSGKFKREQIDGRSHIVTTMMPIRGDITMNRLFYPDSEVAKSFKQLHMLPAPNGHPTINGVSVSAFHPVATNKHNIGGFLRNPRKKGKRVFAEFVLDETVANNTDEGKEAIRRIEAGEKIGVSTGLTIKNAADKIGKDDFGKPFDRVVGGFKFDHVAILMNEAAAGEHAGTELLLNADETEGELFVCNIDELDETKVIQQEKETQHDDEKVNDMDKNKIVLAIIGNSSNKYSAKDIATLEAMSEQALLDIISTGPDVDIAKAIVANSGIDFEGYETFTANKAEFDKFQTHQEQLRKELVDKIVTGSPLIEAEMLTNKSLEQLKTMVEGLEKDKKHAKRVPEGRTTVTNTAAGDNADYSGISFSS